MHIHAQAQDVHEQEQKNLPWRLAAWRGHRLHDVALLLVVVCARLAAPLRCHTPDRARRRMLHRRAPPRCRTCELVVSCVLGNA